MAMKYIELPAGKKARICRALGVSRVTLWSALTFQTQSALAEKIRRMALQDGGRETEPRVPRPTAMQIRSLTRK